MPRKQMADCPFLDGFHSFIEDNKRMLSEEEEAKLFAQCPDYLNPIVITALNTGMRRSEVLCMKACSTNALQPAPGEAGPEGIWTPVLKPRIGYCEYYC
jgi:hypothetical protein